jgi:hypothetical protein
MLDHAVSLERMKFDEAAEMRIIVLYMSLPDLAGMCCPFCPVSEVFGLLDDPENTTFTWTFCHNH